MKIILNAQGTQGDVRPILALGLTLRSSGHEIEFCAPVNFKTWVSQYGFIFHPVGGDTQKFLEQTKDQMDHPLKSAKALARTLHEDLSAQFASLIKAVSGADLIVGSGLDFVGHSIAEHIGIPYRFVCHTPVFFKSRCHPPMSIPFQKLPGWMNRFCWWGNEVTGEKILGLRNIYNANRKQLGLKKVKHMTDYMMENTIVAADRVLAPIPSDIHVNYIQTGYWHLKEEQELDDELNRFIQTGPPPVYIGFGSMTDPSPAKTAMIFQELINSQRFRLIISKGWAKLGVKSVDQNTFLVDYVPHAKLFPKMAAIVHHGGAGTTHTAARAGVPQVIIPHAFDQYYWGERIFNLKIGPTPLVRARLTGRNLIKAIEEAVTNPDFQRNTYEIMNTIRQQDGLHEVLNYFETITA
jgi:UDP:flavonoid glycosyltransferase YjiC (YdhE family)